MRRRTLIAATGAAVVGSAFGPLLGGLPAASAATVWQPRWAPEATVDGLLAFEGVEDDRANSHPAGQPHITVDGNSYRFAMHVVDRDTMTDRQRQEVKGVHVGEADVIVLPGETWRWTRSMFVPGTLKATTSFTHIMQMKAPGTDSLPIVTQSLQRVGGTPRIQLHAVNNDVIVGQTNLAPLQNKWIDVEFEMTIGDGTNGAVRWALHDGATTVIDVTKTGIDTFLTDRVRPKWGICGSLGDTSGSLQDTYLLLTKMRGYKAAAAAPPVRYEAENAARSGGTVDTNHANFSGTGFVNTQNAVGAWLEWTVTAAASGPRRPVVSLRQRLHARPADVTGGQRRDGDDPPVQPDSRLGHVGGRAVHRERVRRRQHGAAGRHDRERRAEPGLPRGVPGRRRPAAATAAGRLRGGERDDQPGRGGVQPQVAPASSTSTTPPAPPCGSPSTRRPRAARCSLFGTPTGRPRTDRWTSPSTRCLFGRDSRSQVPRRGTAGSC